MSHAHLLTIISTIHLALALVAWMTSAVFRKAVIAAFGVYTVFILALGVIEVVHTGVWP